MQTTLKQRLEKYRSHYQVLGFWDTLRHGLAQLLTWPQDDGFDRTFGTDTSPVRALRPDERPEPGQAVRSIPAHPKVLRYILRHLGIDYRDFIFVDFGCGKGRALLCASDFPFQRIIGVEWSPDLCTIARQNLKIYPSHRQKCTDLEVHCLNVLDFQFPASPTVLYLYNPFPPKITQAVFDQVQRSVLATPRRFLVVFLSLGDHTNQLVRECFERFGLTVLRTCLTLTPWASWVLGEVRCPPGPPAPDSPAESRREQENPSD